MPRVSESYSDPRQTFTVSRNGLSNTLTVAGAVSRTQIGHRSGPLSTEQERGMESRSSSWATTVSRAAAYDEQYEYTTRKSRAFMVNDRDYSETTRSHSFGHWDVIFQNDSQYRGFGGVALESVTSGWLPARPAESVLRSRAAGMMRRSVPTKLEIDLTRTLGELREAPQLFRAANYIPKNLGELGGSYLNMLFGVQPTVSDLQKVSETVLKLDTVLRRYIRQERTRIRRSSTIDLGEASGYGEFPATVMGWQDSYAFGPMRGRAAYLVPAASSSNRINTIALDGSWSWKAHRSLRSFATFEYFVPRPANLEGRLREYRHLANRVFGGGLTASTAYDLTPWTWLANWFVDVGGLLRYQQNVVDNQVVTSRSGFSLWEEFSGHVSVRGMVERVPGSLIGPIRPRTMNFQPLFATISVRNHTRRRGSPYSMSPTWSFSTQQWAILGALGLSRSSNVPIIND